MCLAEDPHSIEALAALLHSFTTRSPSPGMLDEPGDAAMGNDERRLRVGRRSGKDGGSGVDTRSDEERRSIGERRSNIDRRSGLDRRSNAVADIPSTASERRKP